MLQLNFGPENRKRLKMGKTENLHGQSLLILCVGDMTCIRKFHTTKLINNSAYYGTLLLTSDK